MSNPPPSPPSASSSATADPPQAAAAAPPAQQHPTCSACKHQRRKCPAGCPLARYFPADKPGRFRNAHRLIGVKNILRFMATDGPKLQDDCMTSIIFEANTRAASPMLGSYGASLVLQEQLARAEAELKAVREQLVRHRLAALQPQPLLYAIPVGHQQPFYGDYAPPGTDDAGGVHSRRRLTVEISSRSTATTYLLVPMMLGAVHSRWSLPVEMCHRRQATSLRIHDLADFPIVDIRF
ncbi:hypothetical protein ACQ4PT_043974 [Festuca glaucescens]